MAEWSMAVLPVPWSRRARPVAAGKSAAANPLAAAEGDRKWRMIRSLELLGKLLSMV
jgi:hypothetical protein